MARKDDTVRYTAEEIKAIIARGEDRTDWAKVDATTQNELQASIAADPDDVHERTRLEPSGEGPAAPQGAHQHPR